MSDKNKEKEDASEAPAVPAGFGLENEHPMLTMPFSLRVDGQKVDGKRLSVTEIEVALPKGTMNAGSKELATISFPFEDFAITLTAQVTATDRGDDDTTVLLFAEPTGAHLAQLRYVLNSYIAGDIVTLKGLMAYTGPTQPKAPKAASEGSKRDRVRSIGVAVVSLLIAFIAASVVFSRYTTAYEMHPVFIDRAGLTMQATVAGQLTYLNPEAPVGEVAYTIASTTGDVLSFQMPQEGQVALASEVFEGATVLPTDLILTIFNDSAALRLRTLISIEGLTRAMQGDPAMIELSDGRKMPVSVLVRDTTRAAALRGDLFVPVDLAVEGESLVPSDTSKSARLRMSKTLRGVFGLGQE
jgi:alginate biosynthesis protein Alg44